MLSSKEILNQFSGSVGCRVKTAGTHTPDAGEEWLLLECDTDTQFSANVAAGYGDNLPDAVRIEGRLFPNQGGFTSVTITSGRLLIWYRKK